MFKNILFLMGLVVIFVLSVFLFTQENHIEKNGINIRTINANFASIQSKLAAHKNDYDSIAFYTTRLEQLQDNAKDCVSESKSQLKMLDELLKNNQADRAPQLEHADNQYLEKKQAEYTKSLSECRLFVYRSDEVIAIYKDMMQKLSATQILRRSTPIWELTGGHIVEAVGNINLQTMFSVSGFGELTHIQWVVGCFVLLFGFLMAIYARSVLKGILLNMEDSHVLWRSFLNVLVKFVLPCTLFGFCSIFLSQVFDNKVPVPTLALTFYALLIYSFGIAITKYLFFPSQFFSGLFFLPIDLGRRFYRRIVFLFTLILLGYLVSIAFREQMLPDAVVDMVRTIFIAVVAVFTIWTFWLWRRFPVANQWQYVSGVFFSGVFSIVLGGLAVMECLGYHQLAVFAFTALFFTVMYTILFAAMGRLLGAIYQWVDNKQYVLARKIHQFFGVKFNKKLYEFGIIKIAAELIVIALYVIVILKSWNVSGNFLDKITDGLLYGFKFLGLDIIPLQIVLAMLSFSFIMLFGRFVATSLAQRHHLQGEQDTQIALSTITIYVFFAIALTFALLVTGVNFTGLAIVAGALSVGVGLGLQSIVNNFVSGLILLIEKPIKPGDRIVIGNTEGFVKKIRFRSTQIATMSKEDVIIPNSDLVTQQVINYMFRDRNFRVTCYVSVEYGTDVDLVKKLLLEVASRHQDVVGEAPNEPAVFFSTFGDSGLEFELWCVIHDVNKKFRVRSELNFAINAIFKAHNIVVPFPQTDIHIKDYPKIIGQKSE